MDKNNPSSPSIEDTVTELEKLEITGLDVTVSTKVKTQKENDSGPSGSITECVVDTKLSEFKHLSDIDRKLSELQCPFTWSLPRAEIVSSEVVSKFTKKIKEFESDEFRQFMCNILIVYELCNNDKLEEANEKLITILDSIKDVCNSCEDEFFASMKRPLQHIVLACEVHLLNAYFSRLHKEPYLQKIIQTLKTVQPYSEMTESEQAGVCGFKAQVFSYYGYSGAVEGLKYAKKALELDPNQAEWYCLTGKIMGRIRRCGDWYDNIEEEEIKLLERAVKLSEKPSYMFNLASAYIEHATKIRRNFEYLDKEMKDKIRDMYTRANDLYMRCLQLKPDCPHVNIECASGMLKFPEYIMDKDVLKKCIKVALEKAPNNGCTNHVAAMFAERHEYDIRKALHYNKISSDHVYGAMADYIRLKYKFEEDYDLIGALKNWLERPLSLPDRHKTLSCIGSYYLFLKRDLFRALNYYQMIMDEDSDSSAITANKPMFLTLRTPINMYGILCTEVHLELNKNGLSKKERNILEEFLNKLSHICPEISQKFADKPSQIQQIVDKSRMSDEKYKEKIQRKTSYMYGNAKASTYRGGRYRGRSEVHNFRKQNTADTGCVMSWRHRE